MNLMNTSAHIGDAEQTSECSAQFGALCYRMHRGKTQILLITSRDTGRWVIPKGWPMAGKSGAQTAQQEAWEEAGVVGQIHDESLGNYSYSKRMQRRVDIPCAVQVFALRVEALKPDFPERRQRQRKWFNATKAARKVDETDLRKLLLDLDLRNIEPGLVAD